MYMCVMCICALIINACVFVHVRINVCVFVHVRVHTDKHIYIYQNTGIYMYVHVYNYVCTYGYSHVCISKYTDINQMHRYKCMCMCTCTYVNTDTHIYIYQNTGIYNYIQICYDSIYNDILKCMTYSYTYIYVRANIVSMWFWDVVKNMDMSR